MWNQLPCGRLHEENAMYPTRYYTMYAAQDHRCELRRRVVRCALEHGIREAARIEGCARNTVRKWLRRYHADGLGGLQETSRAPKRCPHKTPPQREAEVLAQRARTPGFGAARLKREFDLKPSVGAISRILRQNGLTHPRKRKHRTKRDLRAVKAAFAPLTYHHMDVKYLNDIPHFWPFLKGLHLPEFQYTIRDVKTGAAFVSYGSELSATYAELTVRRYLQHLHDSGIDTSAVVIQTDQGGEFQGQLMAPSDRGFTHTVETLFGATHRFIRTGNPNANADVESFHAHEETEFFDLESFRDRADFFAKVQTYQHYWNLARPNSYKKLQTPLDILKASNPNLSPQLLLLPPLDLDNLPFTPGVGHDVPVPPA